MCVREGERGKYGEETGVTAWEGERLDSLMPSWKVYSVHNARQQ